MKNITLFITTGLGLGFIISYSLRPYFHYAINNKNPLKAFLWILYLLVLFFSPLFISNYLENLGLFGKLEKIHRTIFLLLWFVPFAITGMYHLVRVNRQKQKKNNPDFDVEGEKNIKKEENIPNIFNLLWVFLVPGILYYDFFVSSKSMLLGAHGDTKTRIIVLLLWSIPPFILAIKLLIRIIRHRQKESEKGVSGFGIKH